MSEDDQPGDESNEVSAVPAEAKDDPAERPGTTASRHDHDDKLVDEWGEESFPASDPPSHY